MNLLDSDHRRSLWNSVSRGRNPFAQVAMTRDGIPIVSGAFPGVGHLPALAVDALSLFRDAERQLGPVFWISDGFDADSIYCTHTDAFALFRNKVATSEYLQELPQTRDVFGKSVIARDGAPHQHMRSAMNASFQPQGLNKAGIGVLTSDVLKTWVRSWNGRRNVPILDDIREMTLEVIFRMVGVSAGAMRTWATQYNRLALLFLNFPFDAPGTPRRLGLQARAWLDSEFSKMIADVRARPDATGLLPALMSARDDMGEPLSERELLDNLRLLFLAGHETSASTMTWMVTLLAQFPDVWANLRDEALAVPDEPQSTKEIRAFPYAEAVFREALRLYPPVFRAARKAIVDFDLMGHTVRKGTVVTIPIVHLSRHRDLYDKPDAFLPGRWLGRKENITPLELAQFGGGPHFCLGYHLAWMEAVQFAVMLARTMPKGGPRLDGPAPEPRYLPLLHPSGSVRVRFD